VTGPASTRIYDSDRVQRPLIGELVNLWEHRRLLRILVVRDLTFRYKRSYIGVWWTLLNPLLFAGVMWIIFSQLFRFEIPDGIPYIVYLLSGLNMVLFFTQGALAAGGAIVHSANILTKVYVPPECFAVSAAIAALLNFLMNLAPLIVIQLIAGVGVPPSIVLVPIPALFMVVFVAGVGLLIAAAAVYFYDILEFVGVLFQLVSYLTPSFYPVSIVPSHLKIFVELNPLYSFLTVFRHFLYRGDMPPLQFVLGMVVSSLVALLAGLYVFSRSWRRLVVML
jgi:ABC-2 type transport system permease protein